MLMFCFISIPLNFKIAMKTDELRFIRKFFYYIKECKEAIRITTAIRKKSLTFNGSISLEVQILTISWRGSRTRRIHCNRRYIGEGDKHKIYP